MNYVTGVVMQFTTQNSDEVTVKARGRFISRAVDVAEVATKRFLVGQIKLADKGVKIDSEEFENKEGNKVRVSTVEIKLVKVAASAVILAMKESDKMPHYSGLEIAAAFPKSDFRIFGKPTTRKYRRMGVALAYDSIGASALEVREHAKKVADAIKVN